MKTTQSKFDSAQAAVMVRHASSVSWTRKMRILPSRLHRVAVAALALLALPMAVQAGEYWLKTVISNPISHPEKWVDSSDVPPSSISADDVLHIDGGKTVLLASSALTYNGVLHIGAEDGATGATIRFQNNMTLGDLRWHWAVLQVYTANKMFAVSGKAIVDNPSATHRAIFTASQKDGKNRYGGLFLNADLQSSSDFTGSILMDTVSSLPEQTLFVVGGNNENYFGKFNLSMPDFAFVLAHDNALGSPSISCADALSVEVANAILSVTNGVTLNAARGITINASGFRIRATTYDFTDASATPYENCSSFELPMPITGTYGFTKDGEGMVTLSGAYTAGDIIVTNGTLDIAATASFPAGQNISVASGASLIVHQSLSGFNISGEGTWEQVLDPLVVEYDDSTRTATAIARGSSYAIPDGVQQPISLSEPVALPLHPAPARQEILTVAAGANDLSADDFVDTTEKTYGLPKTSFTVEKDGAGVQHVYLTIRPVIVSLIPFNNIGINGNATTWSNGSAAQPGFDYLITNTVNGIENVAFAGDSLTIAEADVYSRENSILSTATIYPGNMIRQNRSTGGGRWTINGNICIAGEYGGSKYLTFQARYAGGYHRLLANLSGAGSLKLVGAGVDAGIGANILGSPQLYGDNSAYFGKMYVTYDNNNTTEYIATPFGFNSAAALGGALDEFKFDSLQLDRHSMICPATSMEFSTENRGIYGSGPFGFDITNGVTFKVGVPVRMDDDMFKHGEGDLLLGGAISFGDNSSKTCYVREGGIGALNDAAVAGLDVVFSNGTKIILSPEATLVNGFTGVSFEPADATVSVGVAGGSSALPGEKFTVVIATVPTSAGDLSSRFELEEIKGFIGTIVTEGVTEGEIPCTRYSAKYTHCGLVIFIR